MLRGFKGGVTMSTRSSKLNWKIWLSVVVASVFALPVLVAGPAGATTGESAGACGELSFGFGGTRLLNDGISTSAGPFPADIPAGTYTVTLISHDNHTTQVDGETQPGEQFQVVLDSGYTSAPSLDIPDDVDTVTTVLTGQQINDASAISVQHGGVPGINSVDVVCVGFTLEQPEEPAAVPDPTPEPVVVPDPTPEPGPSTEVDPTIEFVDDPEAVVIPKLPTVDIGEPASVTNEPAEPTTDVASVQTTNDNVPILAITGPSTRTITFVVSAMLLIVVGAVLVRRERAF